jgi:putative SOS response-associated peptidase YedK
MCGRYYRRSDKQRLAEAFRIGVPPSFDILPDYNVAPQTFQPVVRLQHRTVERELALLRWGLIPFWAKDAKVGMRAINARSETVTTSPLFREAMLRRRCLVPADGFFEWQKTGAKTRQPWAIGLRKGAPMAFAGLWERWKDPASGEPLETYTILTTEPNELTAGIHDRMPVILAPRDYERWLLPGDPERLPVDLLRPWPAEETTAWKVDPAVGNVRNNEPALCDPVSERPEEGTLLLKF